MVEVVKLKPENLVPNSLVKLPVMFWFYYFEITVTSCQLDLEFKNALVRSVEC